MCVCVSGALPPKQQISGSITPPTVYAQKCETCTYVYVCVYAWVLVIIFCINCYYHLSSTLANYIIFCTFVAASENESYAGQLLVFVSTLFAVCCLLLARLHSYWNSTLVLPLALFASLTATPCEARYLCLFMNEIYKINDNHTYVLI